PEPQRSVSAEDERAYGQFHPSAPMIDLKAFDDDLAIPIAEAPDDANGHADSGAVNLHDAFSRYAGGLDVDAATTLTGEERADVATAEMSAANTDAFDTLDPEVFDHDDGPRDHARGSRRIPRNVHERLRGLNLAAQIKMATSGEQQERIVLERLYGKNVW